MQHRAPLYNHCCSGKQWVLHKMSVCICSRRHPAWKVHAPFYYLLSALLYNIFPHYLINGTIFEKKKLLNTQPVFRSSLQIYLKHFTFSKELNEILSEMYIVLRAKYPLFYPILMKLEFSRQICGKQSNIKFHEIRPAGGGSFHLDGQTDRHDGSNSRILQFCKLAYKRQRFYMKIYKQFWVYVRDSPNTYLSNTPANKSGKRELNITSLSYVFCSKFYKSPNGDGQTNGMCRRHISESPRIAYIRISGPDALWLYVVW